jgi:osmotically-inducible protein OsmY
MSDEPITLENRVDTAISRNPHLAGLTLRIEARAGRIVLRGTVGSFYQKQVAQEAVRTIEGVDEIENQLEVSWS